MRKLLLLAAFFTIPSLWAQNPAPSQTEKTKPAEQAPTPAPTKPDPKLHADAVKLVEASGAKKRLEDGFPSMLEDGKKQMMKQCPQCSEEFANEWTKRMSARIKADPFLEVFVKAYERNFTDEEILELISLQENKSASPPVVSEHLQAKIKTIMPSLMGEITGGCAEIGARLGGEIGEEIEKEHPEWVKSQPGKKE